MQAVRPASVVELAAAVRDGGTLAVRGAGTKWAWGGEPAGLDTLIETTALDAVVEHAAGDLVVRAQAGVRLLDLQDALAAAGQWLALDPPEPAATLGGVVATNASGPRRHLYGTARDLLIGVTFVLADGTVAKAGGKVVKNVAGYDLAKLLVGSYGTLAVLAELTFRLHPLPEARRAVHVEVPTPERAGEVVRAANHSQQVPSAVEYADGVLVVLVEGVAAGVDARAERLAAELGGTVVESAPVGFGSRPWQAGEVGVKVVTEPASLAPALHALAAAGATAVSGSAGVGVLYAALPSLDAVVPLRQQVAAYDGSVVVLSGANGRVDPWGEVKGLELMRRVKDRFDPEHRLAPRRFVGGI